MKTIQHWIRATIHPETQKENAFYKRKKKKGKVFTMLKKDIYGGNSNLLK